jgi:phosphoserine aminotransferase
MSSNPTFFTPGPSQLYPTVENHIKNALDKNIPSISHRSPQYIETHKNLVGNLKKVFNIPDSFTFFVGGSATQFMERAIQNCVEETSFHFVNGSFSRRFQEISRDLGKNSLQIKVPLGETFDFDNVEVPEEAELITFTSCETSTGVEIPTEEIYKIADRYPDKLIAVDAVSSAPYYDLDFNKVDIMVFSVQKGFGMPAGLGIAVVSERAIKKSKSILDKGISVGSYNSFPLILGKAREFQTLETPNVLGVYLLNKVLEDMLEYGIEKIRQETLEKAELIYSYFENHSHFSTYIKDKKARSKTVAVIKYDNPKEVLETFKKLDLVVGGGYGEEKDTQFRIANFPSHSVEKVEELITRFKEIYN